MKAILVKKFKDHPNGLGGNISQAHYRMDPPYLGAKNIVVSASYLGVYGPETYIFKANSRGKIISME